MLDQAFQHRLSYRAAVLEAVCETATQDPTGAVKSGYLIIRGPLIPISAQPCKSRDDYDLSLKRDLVMMVMEKLEAKHQGSLSMSSCASVGLKAPITVRDLHSEVRRDWIQLIGRKLAHTTAVKGRAKRMPQEKGIPQKLELRHRQNNTIC
jgi:hypothetical protein